MTTSESVTRLATVVSIAARIEPELLRAARLRLLPDVDVSAEADLWFSELVASRSTRRIVLDPQRVASLRQSLAADPALLNAARAVVTETHLHAPPAIQLEEEIVYLALTGADVADAINTKLTSVLNAIATEGRRGLIDWAARALPAMPAIVQNTTAAAALRLVAGGDASDALHVQRDPAIAALVDRAVPRTKMFARLVPTDNGLCVEIARTELPASHEIELPKTEPLVVELTTLGHTETVDIPREGTLLRETDGAVSIRTIGREVFRLEEAREGERTTVRILVMKGLGIGEPVLPDEPDIDVVLIAGNVTPFVEDYDAIADQLRERFGTTPILAVPGGKDDVEDEVFLSFLARVGFTTGQVDFAKSLQIGEQRIGIVAIDTALGEFESSRISNLCDGDPIAWAHSHDVAILLTYNQPEDLDDDARERWGAFGPDDVFDFIVTSNIPDLVDGHVVIEFPDPDRKALVSIVREGKSQIRRQEIHERTVVPLEKVEGRRVLVAGIAENLSVPTRQLSRAIGSLLALQGHDLITGGWPGVDYLVAEGFERAAPERVGSIAHYFGGLRKEPDYKDGHTNYYPREEDAQRRAVTAADVVILIEGASGTRSVGLEAISQRKPLIPIGNGAAAELRSLFPTEARQVVEASIATIVHGVSEHLRQLPPGAPPSESTTSEPIPSILAALGRLNAKDSPIEWAGLVVDLGDAYMKSERLTVAITAFEAALKIYTSNNHPAEQASTLRKLATGYRQLTTGDKAENLRRAVELFQAALELLERLDRSTEAAVASERIGSTVEELASLTKDDDTRMRAAWWYGRAAKLYGDLGLVEHERDARAKAAELSPPPA